MHFARLPSAPNFHPHKALRGLLERERRLLGLVSRSAYESVRRTWATGFRERGAVPGMVTSIQTFGSYANFHPHIHALVTNGVMTREGEGAGPDAGGSTDGGAGVGVGRLGMDPCAGAPGAGSAAASGAVLRDVREPVLGRLAESRVVDRILAHVRGGDGDPFAEQGPPGEGSAQLSGGPVRAACRGARRKRGRGFGSIPGPDGIESPTRAV